MDKKTKVCKYCASEIPAAAKICSHCGKKVGNTKLKIIIAVLKLIIAVTIVVIALGGGDDKDSTPTQAAAPSADSSVVEVAKAEAEEITYTAYNCTELFDDLDKNALAAEKKHNGEYIEVTGHLGTIDSSGDYICMGADEDNYDYFLDSIHLDVTSDDQLDTIMEMESNQEFTVHCKITEVGEALGYYADIIEFVG